LNLNLYKKGDSYEKETAHVKKTVSQINGYKVSLEPGVNNAGNRLIMPGGNTNLCS
jgi:hypothetical protein